MVRNALLKIRKLDVRLNDKQKLFMLILLIVLWIIGAIIDLFLPFNLLFNTFRTALCVVESIITFSALYIFSIHRVSKKAENGISYIPIRKRLTFHERRNISIILWVLLFVAVLLTSRPSNGYSFLNSWILVAFYSILTFVRSTRDEFIRDKYKVPDPRDTDFNKVVEENIQKRREKWAEQDKKKKDKK